MGLGAPKKRTKLSNDPNNTAWARNTTNFGHKILASQGWQPGQYLGAEDANHSAHYTAANASHIRVMLREDNLGLGAGRGTSNAETFGLSTLSGIFGRLNGKTEEEVQKVQDTQRDLELRTYQDRKYGTMNFVRGGLLVGDKMEEEYGDRVGVGKKVEATPADVQGSELHKKRKLEDVESAGSKKKSKTEETTEEKKSKRSKLSKMEKIKDHIKSTSNSEPEGERATKSKKDKKRSKTSEVGAEGSTSTSDKKRSKSANTSDSATDDKARLKDEKRARKEEKRKRKEERRQQKASKASKSAAHSEEQSGESSEDEADSVTATVVAQAAAPQALAFGGSRHAVRQRYIQQKRMASMNPQAMKEILMLKAGA